MFPPPRIGLCPAADCGPPQAAFHAVLYLCKLLFFDAVYIVNLHDQHFNFTINQNDRMEFILDGHVWIYMTKILFQNQIAM